MHAWEFYCRNTSLFVRDFALMPSLIAEAGFSGAQREVFLQKLGLIHDALFERAAALGGNVIGDVNSLVAVDNV